MKLFKSLIVAPATLGLLAPMSATANEVTINDFNAAEEIAVTNSRVDGLEARLNNVEAGSFSDTTSASFSVGTVIGAIDGDTTSEKTTFDYQFNIGLSTSFTGEDSLDIAIDNGSASLSPLAGVMGFDGDNDPAGLIVDGVTYTFPLGGATMVVGDATDISATFTGACAYSAFTDYMGNCGTGGSVGVGGNGVTATIGYAFDSGFSLAGGLSSSPTGIVTNDSDTYGIEAAYTADSYGVALAYVSADGGEDPETTYWGLNASYTPESTSLPSVSVGYETEETGGTDASGYFVGLTWSEVGPGSLSVGGGTTQNFASGATETLTYEASYSYAINDGMTITPGVFITEVDGGDDLTGVAVLTSFSF